jgi:hypothetical protein
MSIPHVKLQHLIENAKDARSLEILGDMARDESHDCYRLAHRPGASQQRSGERSARDLFTDQQDKYKVLQVMAHKMEVACSTRLFRKRS